MKNDLKSLVKSWVFVHGMLIPVIPLFVEEKIEESEESEFRMSVQVGCSVREFFSIGEIYLSLWF